MSCRPPPSVATESMSCALTLVFFEAVRRSMPANTAAPLSSNSVSAVSARANMSRGAGGVSVLMQGKCFFTKMH